jgi:Fe-S oxidoreductase/nitrate reductase gamma subunit
MIFGYHEFEGAFDIPMRIVGANIYYEWAIYLLLPLVFGTFFYGIYRRIRVYMLGQKINRFDHLLRRLGSFLVNYLFQKQVIRRKIIGLLHFILFWGFIIMFITTCCFAAWNMIGLPPMTGYLYIVISMLADLGGLGGLIAIVWLWVNRTIRKPDALNDSNFMDQVILVLLFIILLTGFPLEALRLAAQMQNELALSGSLAALAYERWSSPIGYPLALTIYHNPLEAIEATHRMLWWFHMALAMTFIAVIPYTKLWHIFASIGQYFFKDLGPSAARMVYNIEEAETFGVETIEQFTWKDLIDFDACIRCGRCQEQCPAYNTGKALNPKMTIIQNMKKHMDRRAAYLLAEKDYRLQTEAFPGHEAEFDPAPAIAPLLAREKDDENPLEQSLIYDVVTPEVVWSCTNCRACVDVCPMFIEHIDKITEIRRNLVMWQADMPSEAQSAFTNMERNYNPWGVGWAKRADWLEERKVRDQIKYLSEDGAEDFDYLFFGGCAAAFDDRFKKVAEAFLRIAGQAGLKLAYLGTEELCCGDSARRLGNEYLYQTLAAQNIELMQGYGVKKIVTLCPHCYNTLKNEYPQMGGNFEVIHAVELMDQLVSGGQLKPVRKTATRISYHDSCFLGRHNGIYQPPRHLLSALGATIMEVPKSKAKSFCCGAGGGRMWLEEHAAPGFKRINETRTDQLLQNNPELIMTNCPYCLTMIDDGVKSVGREESVQVIDIMEFLWKNLQEEASVEA